MKKRVQIALAVLLVILAGVSAWQGLRLPEREAVYQGKRLTFWLHEAYSGNGLDAQRAEEVLRQAGTNAIPTLLRMLRAKDSFLKVKLMELAGRQHILKIEYPPAGEWHYVASKAFWVLGTNAQSAVPALIEIANQHISPNSQYCALASLGHIGPSAKEAIPSLLGWATNANTSLRVGAIYALGRIRTGQDWVVPVLINALRDPNPYVRNWAVKGLGEFGPNAKLAVPALVEFLNTHDDSTSDRSQVTNALKAIDPEAAAKAGVK